MYKVTNPRKNSFTSCILCDCNFQSHISILTWKYEMNWLYERLFDKYFLKLFSMNELCDITILMFQTQTCWSYYLDKTARFQYIGMNGQNVDYIVKLTSKFLQSCIFVCNKGIAKSKHFMLYSRFTGSAIGCVLLSVLQCTQGLKLNYMCIYQEIYSYFVLIWHY